MTRKEKITYGAVIAGIGSIFLIVKSIVRKKTFREIKEAIGFVEGGLSQFDNFFDPNYYKNYTNGEYWLKDSGTVLDWVNKLNDEGFSNINDDEEVIYSVFRQIPDGVALSQVSAQFANKGYGDLKEKTMSLDKDEVQKISVIISQKPPFRKI